MSHKFESKEDVDVWFVSDGDLGGDVKIGRFQKELIEISMSALLEFVADKLASEKIGKLEQMDYKDFFRI